MILCNQYICVCMITHRLRLSKQCLGARARVCKVRLRWKLSFFEISSSRLWITYCNLRVCVGENRFYPWPPSEEFPNFTRGARTTTVIGTRTHPVSYGDEEGVQFLPQTISVKMFYLPCVFFLVESKTITVLKGIRIAGVLV